MDHWNILLSANLLFMKSEYILVLLQCLPLFLSLSERRMYVQVLYLCAYTRHMLQKCNLCTTTYQVVDILDAFTLELTPYEMYEVQQCKLVFRRSKKGRVFGQCPNHNSSSIGIRAFHYYKKLISLDKNSMKYGLQKEQ